MGIFFTADTYGVGPKNEVYRLASDAGISVSAFGYKNGDAASIDAALEQMTRTGVRAFIVIAPKDADLASIFNAAITKGMTGPGWFRLFETTPTCGHGFNYSSGATREAMRASATLACRTGQA